MVLFVPVKIDGSDSVEKLVIALPAMLRFDLMVQSPLTSSRAAGVFVPMPTLPELKNRITSKSTLAFVDNLIASQDAAPFATEL